MKLPQFRSRRTIWCAAIALLMIAPGLRAGEVAAEKLGFSEQRLERFDRAIQDEIDRRRIAGVVAYVARDGHPVRFRSYGLQDIEEKKPMAKDAIFRIASMSKAVTSVAIM